MNWQEYTQSAWPDRDRMRDAASTSHSSSFLSMEEDTSRMPSGLQTMSIKRHTQGSGGRTPQCEVNTWVG
jgi:hypothetical protein